MSLTIRAQDRSLPPPGEYLTVEAWLAALPQGTVLLVEDGGRTMHAAVEDVIDGLALAPLIARRMREYVELDGGDEPRETPR